MTLSLLFLCPHCGHANRTAAHKLESVKLYLLDKLPPCRRCKRELKKRNYDRSTIPESLMKRALRELGLDEKVHPRAARTRRGAKFIVDEHGSVRFSNPHLRVPASRFPVARRLAT